MKKIIEIKGMMCEHCQKKVEDTLKALNIQNPKVSHEKNNAIVKTDLDDATIINAIKNAGYTVVSITNKKGLF